MKMTDVLNRFEQPGFDGDNVFIRGGSMLTGTGQNDAVKFMTLDLGELVDGGTFYLSPGVAAEVVGLTCAIDNSIISQNTNVTFEINAVPITNSTITIPFAGSAAGDVFFSEPTAARTLSASDSIKIVSAGLNGGAGLAQLTVMFQMI